LSACPTALRTDGRVRDPQAVCERPAPSRGRQRAARRGSTTDHGSSLRLRRSAGRTATRRVQVVENIYIFRFTGRFQRTVQPCALHCRVIAGPRRRRPDRAAKESPSVLNRARISAHQTSYLARFHEMNRIGWTALALLGVVTTAACRSQAPACANPVLLSRGAPVTASNAKNANAVTDGNPDVRWNAEAFPPQWIEIDLGADSVVHHVTVIPEQTPNGHTEHRISGTTAAGQTRALGELKGNTASGVAVVLA